MWSLPSGNLPSRAGDRQGSQLAINSRWDRMNANTEIERKQQMTSEKLGLGGAVLESLMLKGVGEEGDTEARS